VAAHCSSRQRQGLLFTGTERSAAGGGGAAAEGSQQREDLSGRICMSTTVSFGQRLRKAQACHRLCVHACLCFAESEISAGCHLTHESADWKHGLGIIKMEKTWRDSLPVSRAGATCSAGAIRDLRVSLSFGHMGALPEQAL